MSQIGAMNIQLQLDTTGMAEALRQSQERLATIGRETSRQMKIVRAEFGAAMARMDDSASATERLQLQQEYLGQRLEHQRSVLRLLNDTYERSAAVTGENSEETMRLALRLARAREEEAKTERQIRDTTRELERQTEEAAGTGRDWEGLAHRLSSVGETMSTFVSLPMTGFVALATQGTKELRKELALLETNARSAGVNVETVNDAYRTLNSIRDDLGANTETISELLATNFKGDDLKKALEGVVGAGIKFKDTLVFEGIADGLQETLATGAAAGPFLELLERLGVGIDAWNAGLTKAIANGKQQQYVLNTLAKLGMNDVYNMYTKNNAAMLENERANYDLQKAMADLGVKIQPVVTRVTSVLAGLIGIFSKLPEPIQNGILALGGLLVITGPLLFGLAQIIAVAPAVFTAFSGLSVARVAAAAVSVLATAFAALRNAVISNPVVAGITAVTLALGYLAYQSGLATKWVDALLNKLRKLGVLAPKATEAAESSSIADNFNSGTDAVKNLNEALKNNAAATKDAEKGAKKFLAAFDEVYNIPDSDGENQLDLPALPSSDGGTGTGTGGTPAEAGKFKMPEIEWPPIPPFPGWPPIPPLQAPEMEPIALPQPLLVPEPMPILQPVFDSIRLAWQAVVDYVTQPVAVPAWLIELVMALNPVTAAATTLALAWQTAVSLVSGAVLGLQVTWNAAMGAMLLAAQPFITAGQLMSDTWQIALSSIRDAIDGFREWAAEVWKRISDSMQQPMSDAFGALRGFWENHKVETLAIAGAIILGLIGLFGGAPGKIITALAPLLPNLTSVFSKIPGLLSSALSKLPGIASNIASRVSSILSGISNTIGNAVGRASSYVRNLVGGKSVTIPAYASGVAYHPGGLALVGEEGPEIVDLPRGTSVIPHSELSGGIDS